MGLKIKANLIYITVSSNKEAEKISTTLVNEKLVACANILGSSTAIFRWKEKIIKDDEVIVIFKTKTELVESCIKRIVGLHSYDCPAVVVLEIQNGSKEFLKWICDSTL